MKRTRNNNRILVGVLSLLVAVCTTAALILPGITLEADKAMGQGGIDVATAEQEAQADHAEAAPAEEDAAQAEAAPAEKHAAQNEKMAAEAAYSDQPTDEALPAEEIAAAPEAGELFFQGDGFSVSAAYSAKAGLPLDTELAAAEINKSDSGYEALREQALEAVRVELGYGDDADLKLLRLYDIYLLADGAAIEPEAPVDVVISCKKALKKSDPEHLSVVHFAADKSGTVTAELLEADSDGGAGTRLIYLIGSILLLGCGITLAARRRLD